MAGIRLPLDSPEWSSEPSMEKARRLIGEFLKTKQPTPQTLEDFIAEFDGANSVDRGFYFALPYITDFVTEHRESLLEAFPYFCHPFMTPDPPPPECQEQIRGVRRELAQLFLFALEHSSRFDEFDYQEICYTYVAAIAAVYMEPYIGMEITRLPDLRE